MPFHFLAGGLHPDHDTIATCRKTFLQELNDLFVHILLYAQELGVLTLGNISLDGTTIHADASKSSAISYKRLRELDNQLRTEVDTLFALTEHTGQTEMPEGLVIADEIAFRHERLANLAKAKAVLEARAQERYEAEQTAYDTKVRERAAKARQTGSNPRGRPPTPPPPGPRDKDQSKFTDPESRIMQNSNNDGFDQHDKAQAAVEQDSFLMVAHTLSNHPTIKPRPSPPWRPSPWPWASPRLAPWTMGTAVPPTSRLWKRGTLSRTSPRGGHPILPVGWRMLRNSPRYRQRMRVRRSTWLTNSRPRLAAPSTACENVPSNRNGIQLSSNICCSKC